MSDSRGSNGMVVTWPSAVVALGIIAAVAGIAIAAIVQYDTVDDALKFWSALSGLVGIITGAVVTYFFSRGSIRSVTADAASAREATQKATEKADIATEALNVALLHVDQGSADQLMQIPSVSKALGASPTRG